MNAEVSDYAQFHVAVPTDPCAGITSAQRYDATTNPGGVRCTITDAAINIFGPEPSALWSPIERKLGRGFVRPPEDNVGVQYGLSALRPARSHPPSSPISTRRQAAWTSTRTRRGRASAPADLPPWLGPIAAG